MSSPAISSTVKAIPASENFHHAAICASIIYLAKSVTSLFAIVLPKWLALSLFGLPVALAIPIYLSMHTSWGESAKGAAIGFANAVKTSSQWLMAKLVGESQSDSSTTSSSNSFRSGSSSC
jgi:hypothetical protein